MHIESLPSKTRALLESLSDIQDIGDFLLVGGTALALHAAHRVSEDLDFAFVEGEKLPRSKVAAVIAALKARGLNPRLIEHPDAAVEFSERLLDLEDYQQDYAVLFSRYCRSRDVFDLWWLSEHGGIEVGGLQKLLPRSNNPITSLRPLHDSRAGVCEGRSRLRAP